MLIPEALDTIRNFVPACFTSYWNDLGLHIIINDVDVNHRNSWHDKIFCAGLFCYWNDLFLRRYHEKTNDSCL